MRFYVGIRLPKNHENPTTPTFITTTIPTVTTTRTLSARAIAEAQKSTTERGVFVNLPSDQQAIFTLRPCPFHHAKGQKTLS